VLTKFRLNVRQLLPMLALVIAYTSSAAIAETLYFDPINGSSTGNGTRANPFGSLESAIDQNVSIAPNNSLKLLPGFHGYVEIEGVNNDSIISIEGDSELTATLATLSINNSSKLRIQNLSISPYHDPSYNPSTTRIGNIVSINNSSDIEVANNDIFTADDISEWSADDWNSRMSSGISVGSGNSKIESNTVRNINFGITVGSSAHNTVVTRNRVINFAGDGLRGLGDDGLFEYNLVANAFDVNDNHDDGFQAFTSNRTPPIISRVTIRGNQFYYDLEHPNRALIGAFQGIACFDGFFNDWVVENNLLYINHWHGITLLGANNARIVNNTLIDADASDGRLRPWVKVAPLKDSLGGQSGTGNITRNNIAEMENEGLGIIEDHNLDPLEVNLNDVFVDFANMDFNLKVGSPAIDAGLNEFSPSIDIRGLNRLGVVDIGAYEFGATSTNPEPPAITPTPPPVNNDPNFSMPPILILLED